MKRIFILLAIALSFCMMTASAGSISQNAATADVGQSIGIDLSKPVEIVPIWEKGVQTAQSGVSCSVVEAQYCSTVGGRVRCYDSRGQEWRLCHCESNHVWNCGY
jgi:hypothetical protein